jgi:hypothetical protein
MPFAGDFQKLYSGGLVDTILDKIVARVKDEPDSTAILYKKAGRRWPASWTTWG